MTQMRTRILATLVTFLPWASTTLAQNPRTIVPQKRSPQPIMVQRPFASLGQAVQSIDSRFTRLGNAQRDLQRRRSDMESSLTQLQARESQAKRGLANNAVKKQEADRTNMKWRCNAYGSLHDDPSECSDPNQGGVWIRNPDAPPPVEDPALAAEEAQLQQDQANVDSDKAKLEQDKQAYTAEATGYNAEADQLSDQIAKLPDPTQAVEDVQVGLAQLPDVDPQFTQTLDKMEAALLGKKGVGSGQCVALVQNVFGLGNAKDTWKPDGDIFDPKVSFVPLAPIATFVGDHYESLPTGNHAAILVDQTEDGIVVFDQYSGRTPGFHKFSRQGGTAKHQAEIEKGEKEAAAKKLTPASGKDYYTLKYKYYKPQKDADNYSYVKRP